MSEAVREMTFEEEYEILREEAKELFDRESPGFEPPKANCIIRRALRCIHKLKKQYEDAEEQGLLVRLSCDNGKIEKLACEIYTQLAMKADDKKPFYEDFVEWFKQKLKEMECE